MTHLQLLVPLSIGMGLVGLGAFFWALRNGQFEDPQGNALRVLTPPAEDEPVAPADARDPAGRQAAPPGGSRPRTPA